MRVINQTRNQVLADTVIMADSFFTRLRGLLGRSGLDPGCCLVLKPCQSIHTMFMKFDIDVLFVDKHNIALHLISGLPPFRFSGIVRDAYLVMEFPAGTLARTGTSAGDTIILTDNDLIAD